MHRPAGYVYEGVFSLYPHSGGWKNKVLKMPYHQVWGIYRDRILTPRMASNLAAKSKSESIWSEPTLYVCSVCGATYKRDNPDLTHCEYCNAIINEEEIERND